MITVHFMRRRYQYFYSIAIDALLCKVPLRDDSKLLRELASHAFPASEHFKIAQGFVLRTFFPLVEQDVPDPGDEQLDRASG